MAGESRTRDRHVKCPRCNYRCAYERRKCKRCGKLFNHRPRGPRNEPPPEKRSEIARLFQLGVPAARVILPKRCDGKHLLGAILENVELDSIVYSDGRKAHNKLSLNGFHHKRINHEKALVDGKVPINGIENFRGYAKRRLKAYHGGFKHSFELFIRERPLRLNHRDDENALNYLGRILRAY